MTQKTYETISQTGIIRSIWFDGRREHDVSALLGWIYRSIGGCRVKGKLIMIIVYTRKKTDVVEVCRDVQWALRRLIICFSCTSHLRIMYMKLVRVDADTRCVFIFCDHRTDLSTMIWCGLVLWKGTLENQSSHLLGRETFRYSCWYVDMLIWVWGTFQ